MSLHIAPKGRGWTATVESLDSIPEYSRPESPSAAEQRARFWSSLRKKVAQTPGVRIGR